MKIYKKKGQIQNKIYQNFLILKFLKKKTHRNPQIVIIYDFRDPKYILSKEFYIFGGFLFILWLLCPFFM